MGAFDPDMLAGQIDGLVMLNGEIIIVDAVDREGQLRRCRFLGSISGGMRVQLPGLAKLLELVVDDGLQPPGGCLNGPLVDVAGNPAAAKPLGDGTGRAGADEAIQDEITRICG